MMEAPVTQGNHNRVSGKDGLVDSSAFLILIIKLVAGHIQVIKMFIIATRNWRIQYMSKEVLAKI